jgi:hypothetical protein
MRKIMEVLCLRFELRLGTTGYRPSLFDQSRSRPQVPGEGSSGRDSQDFSHSFNNNKLDDRTHFLQNKETGVASTRRLITPARNADCLHRNTHPKS